MPDGSLTNGVPFYRLEIPDEVDSGPLRSGADGMTVDAEGFVYVATKLGIQIADPPGKTVGILRNPGTGDPSNVVFGGPDLTDPVCYFRETRSSAVPSRERARSHGSR